MPKKKAIAKTNRVSNALRSSKSSYLRLLVDPFDTRSFGSKVPDPLSLYTDTYKIHGEFKVVAPAGVTTAAYLIRPNPFFSVVDLQSASGASSTSSATGWSQSAANSYIWSATTPSALASTMTNYRVVAHAVRIRLVLPQQVATGRLIIARAPRSRADVPYSFVNGNGWSWATTGSAGNSTYGAIPGIVANSPFLLEFPESKEYSMIDLMGCDVTIVNKPNAPTAFCFSPVVISNAINTNTYDSNEVVTIGQSPATYTSGAISDNCTGWDDFYIYMDGLPSSSNPIVNFEYVLHLEGVPSISSNTAITAIPSHPPASVSEHVSYDTIMSTVMRTTGMLFTNAPTAYNNIFPGRNLYNDAAALGASVLTGGAARRLALM